jgi:glycosyltransferase involved in cell wall biosynthesis
MEKRKLKICHVITRMIVGGAQENTLLSVIGQIEKGHDVTLVTGPSPGPEGELLKQSELISKYDINIIKTPHLVRMIDPVRDFMAYSYLKNFFQINKFDVIHTHSSKAGIIGRVAACAAKTPFIVHTIHGQAFHTFGNPLKNWFYKKLEWWAAKRCHAIFAVAQAMVDQCMDAHITKYSKYKVVYSGMELEPFLNSTPDIALRESLGIPVNSPVIGTVARLFPLKGYKYFIPSAAKIAEKYPNVKFLIVGDGILKDKIEKEIIKLGIKENFIFTGLVPPDEIYTYISLMNVLVHLSLREGLPRAVVQALASGKPAVGYDLDGTPEVIINGKTGYIVKPKEVDAVADAALKLIKNPKLAEKMGRNGRNLVKIKFDWKHMVNVLEKEYYNGLEQYKDMWKK